MKNMKFIVCLIFAIAGYLSDAVGCKSYMEESCDSIKFAQLYTWEEPDEINELSFKTKEQTIQYHDGQPVFSNKRIAKYNIKKSKEKIIIKRKVISTENSSMSTDKDLTAIYPDVTSKLLSSVLVPRKIKINTPNYITVNKELSEDKDSCTIIIDKLAKYKPKDFSYLGETTRFISFSEELFYASHDICYFNLLKAINTLVNIELTTKDGDKHNIKISEIIDIIF